MVQVISAASTTTANGGQGRAGESLPMVGETGQRGGMEEVLGRLRSCSSSPMWHHIMATSSLISGFSFGIKDTLKHCCPHSSSVGGSKVDTNTLHP